jgi:hypothetical protein
MNERGEVMEPLSFGELETRELLVKRRCRLLKTYEREPNNPTIINHLELLNSSNG